MDAFIGTVLNWPVNFAPRDWAFCDGRLILISSNTALYSLIGNYYGGDGRTTFGLPDLRGRVTVGAGQGPGLSSYQLGQTGGAEAVALSVSEMPSHNHIATVSASTPGSVNMPLSQEDAVRETPQAGDILATPSSEIYGPNNDSTVNTQLAGSTGGENVTISNTGGSIPHANMQPYLVLNYIIALQGIYPSRS